MTKTVIFLNAEKVSLFETFFRPTYRSNFNDRVFTEIISNYPDFYIFNISLCRKVVSNGVFLYSKKELREGVSVVITLEALQWIYHTCVADSAMIYAGSISVVLNAKAVSQGKLVSTKLKLSKYNFHHTCRFST